MDIPPELKHVPEYQWPEDLFFARCKEITDEIGLILDPWAKKHCSTCNSCCCMNCSSAMGYFTYMKKASDGTIFRSEMYASSEYDRNQFQLVKLKEQYGWDNFNGFHSKTGCKLPRDKRSYTCLKHLCDKATYKKLTDSFIPLRTRNKLQELCTTLFFLRQNRDILI